jgi:NADPH2 dehydrogenase
MTLLFNSYALRDCHIRNRIVMSPMSQHAAGEDATPTDWHLDHYGARALGGCGLILLEDTAVEPSARTSHSALGLYDELQVPAFSKIVDFCQAQGATVGVQLAHAGRKAFGDVRGGEGDEELLSASALPYAEGWSAPVAADATALERVTRAFAQATILALAAGFDIVEVHAAHGYLLHQFLSPLTNRRIDTYGGDLAGRARLLLEVVEAVRGQWPAGRPLLVRLPASDGPQPGGDDGSRMGSTPAEMAQVARWCAQRGVDLIDVAGGTPVFDGTRVGAEEMAAFTAMLREADDPHVLFALGGVTDGRSAEELLHSSGAVLVAVGRSLLADPCWALSAAQELNSAVAAQEAPG